MPTAAARRIEAVRRRVSAKSVVSVPRAGQYQEDANGAGAVCRASDVDQRGRDESEDAHFTHAVYGRVRDETVRAIAAYNSGAGACEGPGDTLVDGSTGAAVEPSWARAAAPVAQTSDAAAPPQFPDEDARLARISRGKAVCGPPGGAAAPPDDSGMMVTDSLGRCTTSPQKNPQLRSGEGPPKGQVLDFPLTKPEVKDLERDQATGSTSLQKTGDPPNKEKEWRRDGAGAARVGSLAARGSGAAAEADVGMQPQRGCYRHHHLGAREYECPPSIAEDIESEHRSANCYEQDVTNPPPRTDAAAASSGRRHPSSHCDAVECERRRRQTLDRLDDVGDQGAGGGRPAQGCHRLDHPSEGAGGQRRRGSYGDEGSHRGWGHVPLERGSARAVRGSAEGPPGPLRRHRPPPDHARRRLCQYLSSKDDQASSGAGDMGNEHRQRPSSDCNGDEFATDSAGQVRWGVGQCQHERADRDSAQRGPPGDLAERVYNSRQHLIAQLRRGPSIWPQPAACAAAEESGEDRRWRGHKRPRLASRGEVAAGSPLAGGGLRKIDVDVPAANGGDHSSFIGHAIRGRAPPGATPTASSHRGGDVAAGASGCPSLADRVGSSAAADHAAARVAWHRVDAGSVGPGTEGAS